MKFTIIQDTREQKPWDFSFYGYDTEVSTLKTGDYTIKGMEDKIVIERKRNTGEIAQNIGSKAKAFNAEIDRMQSITNKYMLFEFSPQDLVNFPQNSGIPKFLLGKIRINAAYLAKEVERFENECGITIFFCNNREQATDKAVQLMEEVYERFR